VIEWAPYHDGPLDSESEIIFDSIRKMNYAGLLTHNSQPYEKFHGQNGEIEQYGFIVFYFRSRLMKIFEELISRYDVDYAVLTSNVAYGNPSAVFVFASNSRKSDTLEDYLRYDASKFSETFDNPELVEYDCTDEIASAIVTTLRPNNDMFRELAHIADEMFRGNQ